MLRIHPCNSDECVAGRKYHTDKIYEWSGSPDIDQVLFFARRVHPIAAVPLGTPHSTFVFDDRRQNRASLSDIAVIVREGAIGDNLVSLACIDTHCFRSGVSLSHFHQWCRPYCSYLKWPDGQPRHIASDTLKPDRRTLPWSVRCMTRQMNRVG